MKFKWIFVVFVLLASAAFAVLLPYAHTTASAMRASRRQLSEDLAELEQRIRSEQWDAAYESASREFRERVGRDQFAASEDLMPPPHAVRLKNLGKVSALRLDAYWVDRDDNVVGERWIFRWQDGKNRLDRIAGKTGK